MAYPEASAPYDLDLAPAWHFVATDQKSKAYAAYLKVLNQNPKNCAALHELGYLASSDGYHSAARTIFQQLVDHWPQDLIGRINLGGLLYEDGDLSGARQHFEFVLEADANSIEANRGLGRILHDLGDRAAADRHWRKSFPAQAISPQPVRGREDVIPVLLIGSATRGNIPTQHIFDGRTFAVTIMFAEYYKPELPLPPHSIVFNAIGDADLCAVALAVAEDIVSQVRAPVINLPSRVRLTGRVSIAARLGKVPGVRTPAIVQLSRRDLAEARGLAFPLLLRAAGFHNGQHFVMVESYEDLEGAAFKLPGSMLLVLEYLNARGADGMARKYRVMAIDGTLYPVHLAISGDWKVHYLTSDMAGNPAYRAEEREFLDRMPSVLGETAMAALTKISEILGLDYVGFDFAVDGDGSVRLFEANPTMAIIPPSPEPIWDYRRAPIERSLRAAKDLLLSKARAAGA